MGSVAILLKVSEDLCPGQKMWLVAVQRFGPCCFIRERREFWNSSSPNSRRIKAAVTGRLACGNADGAMNVIYQIAGITSYCEIFNICCVAGWGFPQCYLFTRDSCRLTSPSPGSRGTGQVNHVGEEPLA